MWSCTDNKTKFLTKSNKTKFLTNYKKTNVRFLKKSIKIGYLQYDQLRVVMKDFRW